MGNSRKKKQEGMDAEGSPPESRCIREGPGGCGLRTKWTKSSVPPAFANQVFSEPSCTHSLSVVLSAFAGRSCLVRVEATWPTETAVFPAWPFPARVSPGAIWQHLETLLSSQLRWWWGAPGIQWVEVGVLLGCTWMGPMAENDPAPNVGRAKVEKHYRPEEHFCFNSRTDQLGEVSGALC